LRACAAVPLDQRIHEAADEGVGVAWRRWINHPSQLMRTMARWHENKAPEIIVIDIN